MASVEQIQSIFPDESSIPEAYRLNAPVEQTEYLINGELLHWSGPVLDVYSPVCVQSENGCAPKRIGSYPLLTEAESLAALDADSGKANTAMSR